MDDFQVLNPSLYRRLREVFGEVGVTNQGRPATLSYTFPPTLSGSIKVAWKVRTGYNEGGEQYNVRCPYCGDRAKHLSISHMSYATPEVPQYVVESAGLIANCFHGCLYNRPDRLRDIHNRINITDPVVLQKLSENLTEEVSCFSESADLRGIRTWADDFHYMDDNPPEAVKEYVLSRGLTLEYLKAFSVGWGVVYDFKHGVPINRGDPMLIIPFTQNGTLRGLQARACRSKEECEANGLMRWYTHPALKKSSVLYNIDNAVKFPFVCVAEGASDVWGIGGPGVGIMGHSPSKYQIQLLTSRWAHGALIWLPDTKKIVDAAGRVTDPVEEAGAMVKKFNEAGCFAHGAHLVVLDGKDPGDIPQTKLWETICCQTGNLPQRIQVRSGH